MKTKGTHSSNLCCIINFTGLVIRDLAIPWCLSDIDFPFASSGVAHTSTPYINQPVLAYHPSV